MESIKLGIVRAPMHPLSFSWWPRGIWGSRARARGQLTPWPLLEPPML